MPLLIIGSEAKQKEFIKLYGSVLHLYNILSAFDDFEGHELMDDYEMQNYTGMYVNLWHEYTNKKNDEKEDIMDDLVFEIEIVRQIKVNVDYILELVKKYHKSNCTNTKVREYIDNAIDSSPDLRSKKELIDEFIESLNKGSDIMARWLEFIATQSVTQLKDIIREENIDSRKTEEFMNICFKIGEFRSVGTAIDNIMPPLSIFDGNRITVKERVTEKLSVYFERFYGLVNVVSFAY